MKEYSIGDVVSLNSHPQFPMTVANLPNPYSTGCQVVCTWFDASGRLHREFFDQRTIDRFEGE